MTELNGKKVRIIETDELVMSRGALKELIAYLEYLSKIVRGENDGKSEH